MTKIYQYCFEYFNAITDITKINKRVITPNLHLLYKKYPILKNLLEIELNNTPEYESISNIILCKLKNIE